MINNSLGGMWKEAGTVKSRNSHLRWNPKVHYRVHKNLTPIPILSQMHPVYTFPPCFSRIHSKYYPSTYTWSSEWSLPFRFSNQNFFSSLPCVLHALPSHHPSLYHPSNLVNHTSYEAPHYEVFSNLLPLPPSQILSTLFFNTHNVLPVVKDQVSHPYKMTGNNYSFVYFNL